MERVSRPESGAEPRDWDCVTSTSMGAIGDLGAQSAAAHIGCTRPDAQRHPVNGATRPIRASGASGGPSCADGISLDGQPQYTGRYYLFATRPGFGPELFDPAHNRTVLQPTESQRAQLQCSSAAESFFRVPAAGVGARVCPALGACSGIACDALRSGAVSPACSVPTVPTCPGLFRRIQPFRRTRLGAVLSLNGGPGRRTILSVNLFTGNSQAAAWKTTIGLPHVGQEAATPPLRSHLPVRAALLSIQSAWV
jgi:hypothetical protein